MADQKKDDQPLADSTAKELQKQADKEAEQGFSGTKVDPTPNENYSLETPPDAPTPETDPKLAAEVGSSRFRGSAAGEVK